MKFLSSASVLALLVVPYQGASASFVRRQAAAQDNGDVTIQISILTTTLEKLSEVVDSNKEECHSLISDKEDAITELQDAVAANLDSINAKDVLITELQDLIAAKAALIDQLTTQLSGLTTQMTGTQSTIEGLTTKISTLQTAIDVNVADLAGLSVNLGQGGLDIDVDILTNILKPTFQDMQDQITSNAGDITDLKAQLLDAAQGVLSEDQLSTLKATVLETINAKLASLDGSITTIKSDALAMKTEVADHAKALLNKVDISVLDAKILSLKGLLDDNVNQIKLLQSGITGSGGATEGAVLAGDDASLITARIGVLETKCGATETALADLKLEIGNLFGDTSIPAIEKQILDLDVRVSENEKFLVNINVRIGDNNAELLNKMGSVDPTNVAGQIDTVKALLLEKVGILEAADADALQKLTALKSSVNTALATLTLGVNSALGELQGSLENALGQALLDINGIIGSINGGIKALATQTASSLLSFKSDLTGVVGSLVGAVVNVVNTVGGGLVTGLNHIIAGVNGLTVTIPAINVGVVNIPAKTIGLSNIESLNVNSVFSQLQAKDINVPTISDPQTIVVTKVESVKQIVVTKVSQLTAPTC